MVELRRRERRLAAKLRPASFGRCAAGACALNDQAALELGDTGEHGKYHTTGWRCGVGPRLG